MNKIPVLSQDEIGPFASFTTTVEIKIYLDDLIDNDIPITPTNIYKYATDMERTELGELVLNTLEINHLKMRDGTFPQFLKLPNSQTVFQHKENNQFWIENGQWGCQVEYKDNNITITQCDNKKFIGQILIPSTIEEYNQIQ